ncbi:hypothetical protein [Streptosporangium sp. NPDC048865]|uniref:hypothetical protein n=1 Tax=Streptosporangium sp. NPDC048865 TaxID=3155766 RepID=UPI00344603C2
MSAVVGFGRTAVMVAYGLAVATVTAVVAAVAVPVLRLATPRLATPASAPASFRLRR